MHCVVLCRAEFAILGVFCVLQLDIYHDRFIMIPSLSRPVYFELYRTVSCSVHRFCFRISFSQITTIKIMLM